MLETLSCTIYQQHTFVHRIVSIKNKAKFQCIGNIQRGAEALLIGGRKFVVLTIDSGCKAKNEIIKYVI